MTGDSVYGDNRSLRLWLEEHRHAHVLAVSAKNMSGVPAQQQVKTILAALAAESWCQLSAGDGPKALAGMTDVAPPGRAAAAPLATVALGAPECERPHGADGAGGFAPQVTVLATVVQVAGSRCTLNGVLKRPKARSACISMKCGVARDGIDISRWRCGVCAVHGAAAVHLPAAPPLKKISQASV